MLPNRSSTESFQAAQHYPTAPSTIVVHNWSPNLGYRNLFRPKPLGLRVPVFSRAEGSAQEILDPNKEVPGSRSIKTHESHIFKDFGLQERIHSVLRCLGSRYSPSCEGGLGERPGAGNG